MAVSRRTNTIAPETQSLSRNMLLDCLPWDVRIGENTSVDSPPPWLALRPPTTAGHYVPKQAE